MTCSEARRLLPLFTGEDVSAEDAQALSRHLAGCPSCSREEAALRKALERVREARPEVDAALREEVRQRVLRRISRPRGGLPALLVARPGWVTVAVLILAGGLVGLSLLRDRGNREGTVPSTTIVEKPAPAASQPEAVPAEPVRPLTAESEAAATLPSPSKKSAIRIPRAAAKPASEKPVVVAQAVSGETAAGASPVRIEYQTSDPAVRIIWFVNQPAHAVP